MAGSRKIEIFSAGCPVCRETVARVEALACPSCEVTVLDMNAPGVADRAAELGVRSLPAVAIDGKLTDCCTGLGPDMKVLKTAGLGQPLP